MTGVATAGHDAAGTGVSGRAATGRAVAGADLSSTAGSTSFSAEGRAGGVLHGPGRCPPNTDIYDRQGLFSLVLRSPLPAAAAIRARVVVPPSASSEDPPFAYVWEFTTAAAR